MDASAVKQFALPSGSSKRSELVRATTNVLATIDEGGTRMWNAGLSRPLELATSSGDAVILLGPEPRVYVSAF